MVELRGFEPLTPSIEQGDGKPPHHGLVAYCSQPLRTWCRRGGQYQPWGPPAAAASCAATGNQSSVAVQQPEDRRERHQVAAADAQDRTGHLEFVGHAELRTACSAQRRPRPAQPCRGCSRQRMVTVRSPFPLVEPAPGRQPLRRAACDAQRPRWWRVSGGTSVATLVATDPPQPEEYPYIGSIPWCYGSGGRWGTAARND